MPVSTDKSNWQSLSLLKSDRSYKFMSSPRIVANTSRCFYSAIQSELLVILKQKLSNQGRVYPEWALKLRLNESDWFPVPALTYISYERLGSDWMFDEFCPIAPEIVFEIVQKDQRLDAVVAKVHDYLESGVLGVFLINPYSQTIILSTLNQASKTFTGETIIENQFFPEWNLSPKILFERAGFG